LARVFTAAYPPDWQGDFPPKSKGLLHAPQQARDDFSTAPYAATLMAGLVHRGPAGRAQVALVTVQAGGDGPDVRDFASAKAIDVWRAGPPLLGRADRKG